MENYYVSADKAKLDIAFIHNYLSNESYWAKGIPLEVVQRFIDNSVCFGVYNHENRQVGFARIVSDLATFAYLADVFIADEYRGKGLSKMLMEYILSYPDLQGLRRWMLATVDAHGLYEQFGFSVVSNPERFMEIKRPNIYQSQK